MVLGFASSEASLFGPSQSHAAPCTKPQFSRSEPSTRLTVIASLVPSILVSTKWKVDSARNVVGSFFPTS
jgi:hypothetical protein